MREILLSNGGRALVDDECFERLAAFAWRRTPNGYAARSEWRDGQTVIVLMHREIIGAHLGQTVDHVNGDRLTNTRANLRLCTTAQNIANQRGHRRRASPFKGTDYRAQKRRWRATIRVNGVSIHLGYHQTAEAAARAYDAAARQHFGEFARLNFAAA